MSSLTGGIGEGSRIPKGYKAGRLQQFTPEQIGLFQQLLGMTSPSGQLAQRAQGNLSGFEPQEELAQRDFQNFQGQNASRFSGMGMGARRGSGFQNAQTQGAQDLALQLAGQRQNLQRQALQDLMGISNTLLGSQPYQNFLTQKAPKKPSFWSQLFGAAAPVVGAGIGGVFGGPAGAMVGGQLGSALGSGFRSTEY